MHNVYRYPNWLRRYGDAHSLEVKRVMDDIAAGHEALRLAERFDDARRLRWSAGPHVRRRLRREEG